MVVSLPPLGVPDSSSTPQGLKDEIKKYRHQMTQLQDRIRKLSQRQSPDEEPFRLGSDASYRPYVRTPRGSARPSREATPEPGHGSYALSNDIELALKSSPFLQLPRGAPQAPVSDQAHEDGSSEITLSIGEPPTLRIADEIVAQARTETGIGKPPSRASSKADEPQQKRRKPEEKKSQSGDDDQDGFLPARPTYAAILSGRASPQPVTMSAESTGEDVVSPELVVVKKAPQAADPQPKTEDIVSPMETQESSSSQVNGSTTETREQELLSDSKRLTYAEVARMGSPVPHFEVVDSKHGRAEASPADVSEDPSYLERREKGSAEDGSVSLAEGDSPSQKQSAEEGASASAEEAAGKRKAKKKRKGQPEEASAREASGEGGGGNAGRRSDGCLDSASKV